MAIKWLDAKRLQGTNAERLALSNTSTMGSGADGTNIGSPTSVSTPTTPSGLGDNSLHFNGSDQAIDINGALDFADSDAIGTISLWYYNTGTEESLTLMQFAKNDDNTYLTFETRSDGNDTIVMHRQATSGGLWENRNAGSLSTSAWHHAVMSQNGTAVVCYVDGVELTSWDSDTDKSAWTTSSMNRGRIGCRDRGGYGNGGWIEGNIMEVALWNVALSEAQVQDLWDSGDGKPATTYSTGLRAYYTGDNIPATNEAVAVYPNLPNGTIFNETDTYKYFMFDGTDTWNQMVSS